MRAFALLTTVLLATLAAGCAQSGDGEGTFVLRVTDQPDAIGDFAYLNVTVTKITLTSGDNETRDLEPSNETFDLTKLVNGNTTTLFNGTVPAGNYSRLDLHFENATGVLAADGSEVPVSAPSGRIFLNTPFEIAEGQETEFLFDIVVHMQGNGDYQFKPNADGSGPGKKAPRGADA